MNSSATVRASSPRSVSLGAQLDRAGLQAREVQQVGRQLAQARRPARAPGRRKPAPRLLVELLVLEQLEEAAEREDRRAQLVRGGRDEPPARGVQLRRAGAASRRAPARAGRARRRCRPGSGRRSRRPPRARRRAAGAPRGAPSERATRNRREHARTPARATAAMMIRVRMRSTLRCDVAERRREDDHEGELRSRLLVADRAGGRPGRRARPAARHSRARRWRRPASTASVAAGRSRGSPISARASESERTSGCGPSGPVGRRR